MKRILKVLFLAELLFVNTNLSAGEAKAQSNINFEIRDLGADLSEVYGSYKQDLYQLEEKSTLTADSIFKNFIENNNSILQSSLRKKESTQLLNKLKKDTYISYNEMLTEYPSYANVIKYKYNQQIFSLISDYGKYNMNQTDVLDKAMTTLSNIDADSTGEKIHNYIILQKKRIKDIINESIALA